MSDSDLISIYQHSQLGTVIVLALSSAIGFSVGFGKKTAWKPVPVFVLITLLILLPLFYNLQVRVTQNQINCSFGIGLISKTIPLEDIKTAKVVKNPWYFGWGIRAIPGGWMFNVSGWDAVELNLKSDQKFRIGTDDPDGLLSAVETHLHDSQASFTNTT